ncbi:MAG: hypothetical protein Q9M30_02230 [Mariprofundaceae bacterium]|nr:hypothetical protein [Mariprofundaceae bacterium]
MRWFIVAIALLTFPFTASASKFLSVDDRADIIKEELKGNNSYQAHLARKFASFASDEVSQHDLITAKAFIKMAEEAAVKAGGAK